MIDHIIMSVGDVEAARLFYEQALAPLEYRVVMEMEGACGFGILQKPDFFIRQGEATAPKVHIAFASRDRATVDAFYAAAIAAGGSDNGPPGLREDYHPNYYGAFVLDPDGHNIEAVCHRPE
jgi:catechol 2,3-dioxygenase-like lactoylglutathione lyase family enzyme